MTRIDDAVSRILDGEVRARPVRAPDDRPPVPRPGRQHGPPPGRPAGRSREPGAAAQRAPHAPAALVAGRLRRRQQRRQHRQPGRRLDAHLAGRLHQRHPGDHRSSTASSRPLPATSRSARTPASRSRPGAAGVVVVGETPYAEGFGDVGGPRWAYDPGDPGVPRPAKTMQLSEADTRAVQTVCAEAASCTVLVVSGRPMEISPDLLGRDRRPGRVVAAGQRGIGRRRRALRPAALHRPAARHLAADRGAGADQRR